MRVPFIPPTGAIVFDSSSFEFGSSQRGRGLHNIGFVGSRYQRGAGLGSIFKGLFRAILPIAKQAGKHALRAVGKEALRTGVNVAGDLAAGRKFGASIKEHGVHGIENLVKKGVRKVEKLQKGRGGRIVKKKPKSKGRKQQSGSGLGFMKVANSGTLTSINTARKAKKRRISDALGTYYE